MLDKLFKAINQVKQHPGFDRYIANTSWLFVEKVARIFVGLFIGIWIARYLGPEKFGLLSFVFAFCEIFTPIARLGLDKILVKDMISSRYGDRLVMGTAFRLRFFGSVLSVLVIGVSLQLFAVDQSVKLYVLILSLSYLFLPFEVVELSFQSKLESRNIAICRLIQLAVAASMKLYLIWTEAALQWFVIVLAIENIVYAASLMVVYLRTKRLSFIGVIDGKLAKQYVKNSLPLILSGLVIMLQSKADQLMLKSLVGDQALGYYSAAARLIDGLGLIPSLLVTSLFPALIHAKAFSSVQYQWRVYNLYRLMALLFIVIALPLYISSHGLVVGLYGASYEPAAYLFSIMLFRLILVNYDVVRTTYLMTEGHILHLFLTTTLGATINIALNFYWIPIYEAKGAIISTIVSYTFSTFVFDWFNSKTRPNLKTMYKSLLIKNFSSSQ